MKWNKKITIPSAPKREEQELPKLQKPITQDTVYRVIDHNTKGLKKGELEVLRTASEIRQKWLEDPAGVEIFAFAFEPLSQPFEGNKLKQIKLTTGAIQRLLDRYNKLGMQEESTRRSYLKSFDVVTSDSFIKPDKSALNIDQAFNTKNGISYYKAAINMSLAEWLDRVRNHDTTGYESATLKRVQRAIITLLDQPHLLPGVNLSNNRKLDVVKTLKKERNRDIDFFNPDYQMRAFRGANNRYKNVLSVMSLTGCRPAEIETGIRVSRNFDDEIAIHITNAKSHGERLIVHNLDNIFTQHLAKDLDPGQSKIIQNSTGALREYIRVNRESWGISNSDKLCAYSWRYSMATSCALHGMGEQDVEATLGHWCRSSKLYYINRSMAVIQSPMPKRVMLSA